MYAIVVACISAVTTLLYLVPFVLRFMLVWVWDLVLFVLWIALFGVFGKVCFMFPPGGEGLAGRKRAVVDAGGFCLLVASVGLT